MDTSAKKQAEAMDSQEIKHGLGCPPSQDASHHQDYYIFSRGSL